MIRFDPNHLIFKDYFTVAGTGSRAFNNFDDAALLDQCCLVIDQLEAAHGRIVIVSGGAQGWDHYMTLVARDMGKPLALVIPSPEYPDYYWGPGGSLDHKNHLDTWEAMVEYARVVMYVNSSFIGRNGKPGGANYDRNEALVTVGKHFLTWEVSTAPYSGTQDCMRRIKKAKIPYTAMNKEKDNVLRSCGYPLDSRDRTKIS